MVNGEPINTLVVTLTKLSFEERYREICRALLSLTRTRSLPKALQLHCHVIKTGLSSVPLVSHHLINLFSKTHLPQFSRQIFQNPSFKKSQTSWSSIISCFSQNDLPEQALVYFNLMMAENTPPDDHIFPSAIKACATLSRLDIGKSIHSLGFKTGFLTDVFVGSSVVDMYAKCGDLASARDVFDEMPYRNVVSWSGLIYGYTQLGQDEEALKLFKQALYEGLEVNDFTFSSVVRVCGNSTLLELGREIQGLCVKTSYDSSSFVGSALISLYSKCGVFDEAYRVFNEIHEKNLGMWNSMLIACAQHSHSGKAFGLFREMESVGMRPNFITFLCVIYACSHGGLVEEGKYYFQLMKEYKIEPGHQHYASLVDLLGRAGKLKEASEIIEKMPIKPTESVWGALLTGSRLHGDAELAAYAADKVFELGPVGSGMHVMLSNAYAAVGRYDEAAKTRKMLRDRGVRKETGLSWVEEGNRVHTFAAGDRSHSKWREIYLKLEELGDDMARAGYVPDTSFVLREVGSDEKNEAIRFHSERLAIAFGLITFTDDRPIRVMKNLRVCGDCHVAIKFMSKCTGRVIIVRDNNRFHRFEDGRCSCGDYW